MARSPPVRNFCQLRPLHLPKPQSEGCSWTTYIPPSELVHATPNSCESPACTAPSAHAHSYCLPRSPGTPLEPLKPLKPSKSLSTSAFGSAGLCGRSGGVLSGIQPGAEHAVAVQGRPHRRLCTLPPHGAVVCASKPVRLMPARLIGVCAHYTATGVSSFLMSPFDGGRALAANRVNLQPVHPSLLVSSMRSRCTPLPASCFPLWGSHALHVKTKQVQQPRLRCLEGVPCTPCMKLRLSCQANLDPPPITFPAAMSSLQRVVASEGALFLPRPVFPLQVQDAQRGSAERYVAGESVSAIAATGRLKPIQVVVSAAATKCIRRWSCGQPSYCIQP